MIEYLSVVQVIELHEEMIKRYGGLAKGKESKERIARFLESGSLDRS